MTEEDHPEPTIVQKIAVVPLVAIIVMVLSPHIFAVASIISAAIAAAIWMPGIYPRLFGGLIDGLYRIELPYIEPHVIGFWVTFVVLTVVISAVIIFIRPPSIGGDL
jgi:hypothetical protein